MKTGTPHYRTKRNVALVNTPPSFTIRIKQGIKQCYVLVKAFEFRTEEGNIIYTHKKKRCNNKWNRKPQKYDKVRKVNRSKEGRK